MIAYSCLVGEEFLDDEDEEGIVVTLGDGGGLCWGWCGCNN